MTQEEYHRLLSEVSEDQARRVFGLPTEPEEPYEPEPEESDENSAEIELPESENTDFIEYVGSITENNSESSSGDDDFREYVESI